jgi:hypothetical protein
MRTTEKDEPIGIVIAAIDAPLDVVDVDEMRVPTTRYVAPPVVAMKHEPANRRRNLTSHGGAFAQLEMSDERIMSTSDGEKPRVTRVGQGVGASYAGNVRSRDVGEARSRDCSGSCPGQGCVNQECAGGGTNPTRTRTPHPHPAPTVAKT